MVQNTNNLSVLMIHCLQIDPELTFISLASILCGIGKQCRPSSDAAGCSIRFEYK